MSLPDMLVFFRNGLAKVINIREMENSFILVMLNSYQKYNPVPTQQKMHRARTGLLHGSS